MTTGFNASEFQAGLERLDGLLQEAERFSDPAVQAYARALVGAVLDLHAAALGRLLQHLEEEGEVGRRILDACIRDDVVAGLLMLHGLHPLDLEQRIRQALADVQPYLHSHGGDVELLEVSEGVIRLRLQGSCHGCPSSSLTMRQTIEQAILARAPEVTWVEVEGLTDEAPAPMPDAARLALPVV